MMYATTLIIPFSFDCNMEGISKIQDKIQSQGVWQKARYSCANVFRSISELYSSSSNAAMYTATKQTIQSITGSREFRLVSGKVSYEYSYNRLSLFVFATGVGFLCMELIVKDFAILHKLRNVVANNVKHFKKTGAGLYAQEYPMVHIITELLSFNENHCFFTSSNPDNFAQANMLIYVYNDSNSSDEIVLKDVFKSVNETAKERLSPFEGILWGFSARNVVVVSNPNCHKVSSQLQGDLAANYLPLIILGMHEKNACMRYMDLINCHTKNCSVLHVDIDTFNKVFLIESVSDVQSLQKVYEIVKAINKISVREVEDFQKTYNSNITDNSNAIKDRIIGAITLFISAMGVFSILSDGMDVIAKWKLDDHLARFCEYGLYGLCVLLVLAGCYGIYLLLKPKKR